MNLNGVTEEARMLLAHSRKAVALTGAGISTPSGIPDFRSPHSGLWEQVDPFEVASIYAFRRQPQKFYSWIHPLAVLTAQAVPNAAHLALVQMEASGPLQGIITQNVDMLHTRAGSKVVYEVHGHMREMTCIRCYTKYQAGYFLEEFINNKTVPHCPGCGGVLKPDVILYGEQLPVQTFNGAKKLAEKCDLMIIVGSSLEVAPVSELPLVALESGARLIIVNNESTHVDYLADVVIHANVEDVLPELARPFVSG